ncbi:MAG: YtxH domain-containing protein [Acidobacteriota bacterium]|nr:YtxH domain-containing protein [Acidobacteriota bacterium]
MRSKSVWIAFAVGVVAGAAVALLYAPESGMRMRRRLKSSIDDGVECLEHAAEYLKEQADTLTKEAQVAMERTRERMDPFLDRATGAVGTAVKGVQALM